MFSIGIDLGNTSIKIAVISEDGELKYHNYKPHYGNPFAVTAGMLSEVQKNFQYNEITYGMITGIHANALSAQFQKIGDIPAIDKGLHLLCPNAKSAIEIGSQSARYLSKHSENAIPQFAINESCAGGTGSFFEDQMYRLGLRIEDYSTIIENATTVPRISGRCSVFAKTDIIHCQQEGMPTADILLGLCYATIRNLKATIIKNMPVEKPLALCGGIVKNKGVIKAVKDIFELKDGDFLVSDDYVFVQAIGAAQYAFESKTKTALEELRLTVDEIQPEGVEDNRLLRLPPLKLLAGTNTKDPFCPEVACGEHCQLGIDVGSTSTNLVLADRNGTIIDYQYLRTKGDPQSVVRKGLESIGNRLGDKVIVDAVGVTGSGRYLIGKMVGADAVKDEITAQARAAVQVYPETDTVFEIGGQDSKFISINNGEVVDFQMNKICAAGTGSFIEEQADRLRIPLDQYGDIALSAKCPVDLGERCTVFISKNISACLEKGVETADILAGLCHSIIHNYLFKVVGNKSVGQHIVLQGGVCYNPAIVAAFQAVYGDRIKVSPCFSVSGAYGVSLLARDAVGDGKTAFKGYDLSGESTAEKEDLIHVEQNTRFYEMSKKLLLGDYMGKLDADKKTVGVPYVLVVHKLFPMIKSYFEALGFNVLLSNDTNETTITLAQQYAQAETCYPVKLIYGHMAELAQKSVDYIFLPRILTMKHECSHVYHNYGCVFMQTAPQMVFDSMHLGEKGIKLLSPVFSLDFGQKAMAAAMIGTGVFLGKNKALCAKALLSGAMAVRKHTEQVENLGKELLHSLRPDEKVLVMVTRTYGIDDPILNMGIPQELLKRGYKVITLSHIPAHSMDISDEYENLYWPFGQHIISGAKLIRNHPNLYAVYLTNHGCGPDTMLSHLFRQEMGDKPYLSIEVDEHFSKVGVITRIEAFISSLENRTTCDCGDKNYFVNLPKQPVNILKMPQKDIPMYLPYLYPYSVLLADMLSKNGYLTKSLPPTNAAGLSLGKSKTTSKEYLSFAALVGDVLQKAKEGEKMQLLIPATEGSEADGIYGRVIYNMLQSENPANTELVCPIMETLPFCSELCDKIFLCLLAGDIILAAPPSERDCLLRKMMSVGELSIQRLAEIAGSIEAYTSSKKIAVIGEAYAIYNPGINDGIIDQIELSGMKVFYMPLSEYFCFLWKDRCETKKEHAKIAAYIKEMTMVSQTLCENSPFSKGFLKLTEIADELLSRFAGANGRYRFSKLKDMQKCSSACIEIASMYENTQTVLNLIYEENTCPTLALSLEGTNDIALKEKLESFLFYIN